MIIDTQNIHPGKFRRYFMPFTIAVVITVVVAVVIYYALSAFFLKDAEEKIRNILFSQRALHYYIQKVMHPAFYKARDNGDVSQKYYAPEIFSSSFIVRNMHAFYNEEMKKAGLPEVYYKMASVNPRNPVNMADEFEASLIRLFNENREVSVFSKVIKVDGRKYLYYAVPFLETNSNCMKCHGKREDAPPGLQAIYSGGGGFNEKTGVYRAIESIRMPIKDEISNALIMTCSFSVGILAILLQFFFNKRLKTVVGDKTASLETEIIEHKQAKEALQVSEARHRTILETLQAGLVIIDPDTHTIVDINLVAEKMIGETRDQIIGSICRRFICPAKEGECPITDLKRTVDNKERVLLKADGTEKHIIKTVTPITLEGRRLLCEIFVDITDRKRMEDELRESHENLRAAQRLSSIGSWKWIVATDTLQWSEELCRINGYDPKMPAPSYRELSSFYTPESWEKLTGAVSKALDTGDSYEIELDFVRTDGIIRNSIARSEVDYDNSGKIVSLHGTVQDITDHKRAEEEKHALQLQLHQAQKMESLGVLAGGIAHDFNNILAVIMCFSSLGQQKPEKAAEFMEEINKASERAAGLCKQMLAYAGKTQFVESKVDMTALVDDILGMLKLTLPHNVVIKPYLTGDIPAIEGDASQLRQVAVSLIMNASEAIGEEQGDIRVALTKTTIGAEQSEKDYADQTIPTGQYLCLEVTDTGCGMDDETKHRIFEPFYTTKFVGRGLGMSAVLGVVTSHKGALQFTSRLKHGTTFKVYLPVKNSESAGEQL